MIQVTVGPWSSVTPGEASRADMADEEQQEREQALQKQIAVGFQEFAT